MFKFIIRLLKILKAISWEKKNSEESQDLFQTFKVIFTSDSVCMVSEKELATHWMLQKVVCQQNMRKELPDTQKLKHKFVSLCSLEVFSLVLSNLEGTLTKSVRYRVNACSP